MIQTLLPALNDDICRKEAVRLGVAFVAANKPTQRYQNVNPFDTFAFVVARQAIRNGHTELGRTAVNDYLEVTQHDNDRYSGDYGLRRRVDQLSAVSRLFINNERPDEALKFAGMRQSLIEMGYGQANDSLSVAILRRIANLKNSKKAYQMLADWSLAGDGSLRVLAALEHRQRLPDWIPESVSGPYPKFPPMADASFPIATNWYVLAKIAEETGQTEDLLTRLREAHQKQRTGSAEALAITLAVAGRPVPEELLSEIGKRLEGITSGEVNSTTYLPLAPLQLATQLSVKPEHAAWARDTADKFAAVGYKAGRAFVMPWLHRFQYEQGWSEVSKLKKAAPLTHWLSSTSAPVQKYANGLTPPIWLTDGKSQLHHLCGIGHDRLWFRYPLSGDFEVQWEFLDGEWGESSFLANGLRFSSNGSAKSMDVVSEKNRDSMHFPTKTLKRHKWNQHALHFQGGEMMYLINGTLIFQEPIHQGSPWIALYGLGARSSAARNIHVTGKPHVVREVNLLPDDTLRGWSGLYYGQRLPTAQISQEVREANAENSRPYRTAPKSDRLGGLAWTVQKGELVSGKSAIKGAKARKGQSVIRYERPLGEGETLSYEFFYEAGKSAVYPSVGRVAYILRPEGVGRHWMVEVSNQWKLPKDFEVPVSEQKLPLKEAAWNRVSLSLKEGRLRIVLNEESIYDEPFDMPPQGAIFGVFHYTDQTKARVRNITLTGLWPETLPENLFTSGSE